MLKSLSIDQVEAIIDAAKVLNARHPPRDTGLDVLERTFEHMQTYDACKKPLVDQVAALSPDARLELMALMELGRGHSADFNESVEYARKISDAGDVGYIAEKSAALPVYLRDGLKKISAGTNVLNKTG